MKAPIAMFAIGRKSTLNFCRPSADTGCQTRVSLPPQRRDARPGIAVRRT
jgi:hypothetical protein